MDLMLNKVESYWFSRRANKEIDSVGADLNCFEEKPLFQFDRARMFRSSLVGFTLYGSLSHYYYQFCEVLFPFQDLWVVPAKVAFDQTACHSNFPLLSPPTLQPFASAFAVLLTSHGLHLVAWMMLLQREPEGVWLM